MASNSYSDRVNIIKYVKTGAAWHFAPAAKTSNGNVHWNYVVIDGKDEHHPEGNCFIEWRENGARRLENPSARFLPDVLAEAQRKRAAMNAEARSSIEVVPEDPAATALYLKDAVEKYLNEIEMNRARSTFIHYRHTLKLFKQSCRKADVRKIGRDDIMEYEKFLRDRGLGAHTIRNKTIVVLSFLNTLGVEDLITGRDLPDFTPREIETYSIDHLQKFFFACTDEEASPSSSFCTPSATKRSAIRSGAISTSILALCVSRARRRPAHAPGNSSPRAKPCGPYPCRIHCSRFCTRAQRLQRASWCFHRPRTGNRPP